MNVAMFDRIRDYMRDRNVNPKLQDINWKHSRFLQQNGILILLLSPPEDLPQDHLLRVDDHLSASDGGLLETREFLLSLPEIGSIIMRNEKLPTNRKPSQRLVFIDFEKIMASWVNNAAISRHVGAITIWDSDGNSTYQGTTKKGDWCPVIDYFLICWVTILSLILRNGTGSVHPIKDKLKLRVSYFVYSVNLSESACDGAATKSAQHLSLEDLQELNEVRLTKPRLEVKKFQNDMLAKEKEKAMEKRRVAEGTCRCVAGCNTDYC